MNRLFIITLCSAICLSGCATVKLQDSVGSSVDAQDTQNVNILERSVEKLKAAFISRGFTSDTSRQKMQAATNLLMNGLQARHVSHDSADGYLAMEKSLPLIRDDIGVAQGHVDQTRRAAEIYLEMAPSDHSLRHELTSLEAALLASERAGQIFNDAIQATAPETSSVSELDDYQASIGALRAVTDKFGDRVRAERSARLSDKAAS